MNKGGGYFSRNNATKLRFGGKRDGTVADL